MFNDTATILQALSDTLQQTGASTLANQWANIAAQSQTWAYHEIVSALLGRGFSTAQVAAWDRGAEFELDLSLFRALSRGNMLANMDTGVVKSFDRRAELPAVIYTSGGAIEDPLGTAGLPAAGDLDTSEDIYVLPPSGGGGNDFPGEGRGRPTRF